MSLTDVPLSQERDHEFKTGNIIYRFNRNVIPLFRSIASMLHAHLHLKRTQCECHGERSIVRYSEDTICVFVGNKIKINVNFKQHKYPRWNAIFSTFCILSSGKCHRTHLLKAKDGTEEKNCRIVPSSNEFSPSSFNSLKLILIIRKNWH